MLRSKRIAQTFQRNTRLIERDVLDLYYKNQGGYPVTINRLITLEPGEDINLGDQYPEDIEDDIQFSETGSGSKKLLVILKVLREDPLRKKEGFIIDHNC